VADNQIEKVIPSCLDDAEDNSFVRLATKNKRKGSGFVRVCLLLIFCLFWMNLGVRELASYSCQHRLFVRSKTWDAIPVKILDVSIEYVEIIGALSGHGGQNAVLNCKYLYELDGLTYTAYQIDCGRSPKYRGAEQIIRAKKYFEILSEYKEKQTPFMALVDLSSPKQCILFREMHSSPWWVGWATLAIGLVPAMIIIYVSFIRKKKV
jgi:hypothetical protein